VDKHEEFKKAYYDYLTQDNEGFVPDRSGFKAGFSAAWNLLEHNYTHTCHDKCAKPLCVANRDIEKLKESWPR